MNTSRKTAGVTLVVTVLIVMLLLAGVVVVTAQFALSARRNSADQEATLQAQYVAESGVARAQARLTQARDLMGNGVLAQDTTTQATLKTLFANFCGVSESSLPVLNTAPGSLATPVALCNAANSATAGAAIASLLPSNLVYPAGWTASTWTALFSAGGSVISGTPSAGSGISIAGKVALRAMNVQKTGTDSYVLNMQVADITSAASNTAAKRVLNSSSTGLFSVTINRPPFSTFAQFRNQTTATSANGGGNLYFSQGESFNGPVHTNSQLRLSGNPGPIFRGGLSTSAGSAGSPSIDFNGITAPCSSLASIQAGSCITMYPDGAASYPRYVPTVALPTNNNSQARASVGLPQVLGTDNLPTALAPGEIAGGLGIADPAPNPFPNGVYYSKPTTPNILMGGMYVQGDADVKLSTSNTTPRLQTIAITQPPAPAPGGVTTVFQQTAGGSWTVTRGSGPTTNMSGTFNGMLYVNGNVNMSGDGTTSPDVASRTALTVSNTGGDIRLKNSVTYAECPLTVGCPTGSVSNPDATNVLGFFSATGSVLLDGPQGEDMNVNATVLASATGKGFGSVHYYRATRTNINLIGGIVEDQSQTVSAGANDGYIRQYKYDPRFANGYTPPFFPLQTRWVIAPAAKFDIGTLRQSQ